MSPPNLTPLEYSAARAAMHRTRMRGTVVMDLVTFTARCPGCGSDAEWHEERQDTRLAVAIACAC